MDRQFFDTVKVRLLRDKDFREALHLECFEAERNGDRKYAEVLRSLLQSANEQQGPITQSFVALSR